MAEILKIKIRVQKSKIQNSEKKNITVKYKNYHQNVSIQLSSNMKDGQTIRLKSLELKNGLENVTVDVYILLRIVNCKFNAKNIKPMFRRIYSSKRVIITVIILLIIVISIISKIRSEIDNKKLNDQTNAYATHSYETLENKQTENLSSKTEIDWNDLNAEEYKTQLYKIAEKHFFKVNIIPYNNTTVKFNVVMSASNSESNLLDQMYLKQWLVLKEMSEANVEVMFVINVPAIDTYGNEKDIVAMRTSFSDETIKKINFSSFVYENIPEIADKIGYEPIIHSYIEPKK